MARIIEYNDEVIKSFGDERLMNAIYSYFKKSDVVVYAVEDSDIKFIARCGNECLAIDKNFGTNPFLLNLNDELYYLIKDGYEIFFEAILSFKRIQEDGKGMEYRLSFDQREYEDADGYDGLISFHQYNPITDVNCEIQFQQMYRKYGTSERARIYDFHTEKINNVFIDDDYAKVGPVSTGLVGRRAHYYTASEFDSDMTGYSFSAIKDFGLVEFLSKGAYQLYNSQSILRYVPIVYIDSNGDYRSSWPLSSQYTKEELEKYITGNGFETRIPNFMLNVYNSSDLFMRDLTSLISEMHSINKEQVDNKRLLLRIKED